MPFGWSGTSKGAVAPHTLKDILSLKWRNGGLVPSHLNNSNPLTFDLYCLSHLLFPGPLYTKRCSLEHPLLGVLLRLPTLYKAPHLKNSLRISAGTDLVSFPSPHTVSARPASGPLLTAFTCSVFPSAHAWPSPQTPAEKVPGRSHTPLLCPLASLDLTLAFDNLQNVCHHPAIFVAMVSFHLEGKLLQ